MSKASREEFERGMAIMQLNMQPLYAARALRWKQDSIERHFAAMENYSIRNGDAWRGFVSLEWLEQAMFIHTFQLDPRFQGGPIGVGALQALERLCLARDVREMRWRAFRGSAAAALYEKLGLEATHENDHLVNFVHRIEGR